MEPEQVVEMVVVETEVDDSGVARTYTASIFVDENGVGSPLMCQYHNSDSCADVINTMKKGNDAPHLWNRGFWHSRDFIIPVMPSEGIKMMVSTTDEWAEEGDSKTLLWKSPGHEDVEMSFLGFLSIGDGRMAIREMILNEMDLLLGFVEKCTHPRHNLMAERLWKESQKSTKSWWLNRYRVLTQGCCHDCFQHMRAAAASPEDDSDLIPDDDEYAYESPFWKIQKQQQIAREKQAAEREARKKQFIADRNAKRSGASQMPAHALLAKIKQEKEEAKSADAANRDYKNRTIRQGPTKDFRPHFSVPTPKDLSTDDIFDS